MSMARERRQLERLERILDAWETEARAREQADHRRALAILARHRIEIPMLDDLGELDARDAEAYSRRHGEWPSNQWRLNRLLLWRLQAALYYAGIDCTEVRRSCGWPDPDTTIEAQRALLTADFRALERAFPRKHLTAMR